MDGSFSSVPLFNQFFFKKLMAIHLSITILLGFGVRSSSCIAALVIYIVNKN